MSAKTHGKEWQMRRRLAQEAARIMSESGIRDFQLAKRKAAHHLGAIDTRNMPSNIEIEEALTEYQRLFRADSQPQHLQRLREKALEAMRFFKDFSPRLVGPVLTGSADQHSPVTLHLFTDSREAIDMRLIDHGIPFDIIEKRVHWRSEEYETLTAYKFYVGEVRIEALVFHDKQRQAPLSPVDGRPLQRANTAQVEELLHH